MIIIMQNTLEYMIQLSKTPSNDLVNSNNINDQINVEISINHLKTFTTYLSKKIYLEFNKNSKGFLECNYNIF